MEVKVKNGYWLVDGEKVISNCRLGKFKNNMRSTIIDKFLKNKLIESDTTLKRTLSKNKEYIKSKYNHIFNTRIKLDLDNYPDISRLQFIKK